jgi:hypothetical protein
LDQIIDNLVPLDRFDVHIEDNMPVVFNAKILVDQVFSNIMQNQNIMIKKKAKFFISS